MPSSPTVLHVSRALALTLLTACGPAPVKLGPPPPPTAEPAPSDAPRTVDVTLASVGLDVTALDKGTDPCADFFQFACGAWIARTEIPPDKSRWMRSFNVIAEQNELALRTVLEKQAADGSSSGRFAKLGVFYGACMDEKAAEDAGVEPMAALASQVRGVKDVASLTAALTELHRHGIWAVFDVAPEQDFKDATRMIAQLDQNGLGLPDRDYYATGDQPVDAKKPELRSEEEKKQIAKAEAIRRAYVEHVERMMKLAGYSAAAARRAATDVMAVETELAKSSKTRTERRDPQGLYNKIDLAGIEKAVPSMPWANYFRALGKPGAKDVNVTSLRFFESVEAMLRRVKPAVWRSYLHWHVVRGMAPLLSKAFVDESFSLERTLSGQPELAPRWKRCVAATDSAMGELLAQPYVEERFSGNSKRAAETMVREISAAFARELEALDFMDAPTKQRALEKLRAMAYLIGYPAKWKTYDFEVLPARYAKNVLAARAFDVARDLAKIGEPVDREEWHMSPPTVNAYYHPLMNHMVFPAGILQPPFYSVAASVSVNLGGMGMVVGHELTHGFDDEGSQFDATGNLKSWWEPGVREKFDEKTRCVEEQYDAYEALPGLKLKGKLTLGENIADLGGIKLAFRAHRALRARALEVTVAEGFTEDQQFFLGTAQSWCGKLREEEARRRALTDPHAPPKYRINGPLSNLPEFAEAYGCAAGTPMVSARRCDVW